MWDEERFTSVCFASQGWTSDSAVKFNKHIAPRSSDILITLITMLLWIAFQKPGAPFIHGMLCLKSLHRVWFIDAHFLFIHHASTLDNASLCVCVQVYVHVSIDHGFITAKINQSSLNNASPAIMEKYAEYAAAELEGVGGGMKKHKACSWLSFNVWHREKTLFSTFTNELRSWFKEVSVFHFMSYARGINIHGGNFVCVSLTQSQLQYVGSQFQPRGFKFQTLF